MIRPSFHHFHEPFFLNFNPDAGHLFEENSATILCSDLFHQNGDVEPITTSEIVSRFKETLIEYQQCPFANYLTLTSMTEQMLTRLGSEDAKQLVIITPAIMGPAYFREAAEVISAGKDGLPDRAKMMDVFRRHGMTLATPPHAKFKYR